MKYYFLVFLLVSSISCDSSGINGAIDKLNSQIKYLISNIEASVDPTISSIKSDCESSRLRTQTYGWAILAGAGLDIAADWFGESRQPVDLFTENLIYPYGYYGAYGMGFGGPYLLPTYIGSCSFDCSAADFSAVVYKYGLRYGVAGQNIGSSKLQNFGLDAKLALSCLLQQTSDSQDAARIEYYIDDIVDAGTQILALQENS